ncbi:MAG: DUF4065 domain-containing protein [Micavibrio sp.]|nr:DUF4065 domain-containing protein [Micavibrio sp.]
MAQDAIAVANYFVQKGMDESIPISPMKVQKLVYIAHGWHLALLDEPLIEDKVGAWPFGPVIGSIYKAFSTYAKNYIQTLAQSNGQDISLNNVSTETTNLLDEVWDGYKKFSATKLSNMTHENNSPWDLTYVEGRSNIIEDNLIKSYYQKKLT